MVIQSFRPILGGAQLQVEALAPLLAERGADVHCVTHHIHGTERLELSPDIAIRRVGASSPQPLRSASYTLGGTARTAALRPDIIHVHDLLSPASIGLAAGRLTGVPVVAKVLSVGPGGDIDRLLSKPFGKSRLRAAIARFSFITLSDEVDAALLALGAAPSQLNRIPNGVDSARFHPPEPGDQDEARDLVRTRLGIPDGVPLSLYCGRLAPVKRLDVLLEAFAGVPGHLLLAGSGPEEQALRELAAHPALSGRVTIWDDAEDVAPLYRAADLYVSASGTEGMSNSVLEALASGLPVAASPASGMAELIGTGAGVLATCSTPTALRAAMLSLAENRAGAARCARRGRSVARDFALESVADQLMALYGRLLERPRPMGARPTGVTA
ncbi:MAG: hypothetical protein QOG62_1320 [Thermoleophilaceae bacterium]|jgi:glycosyltransferase involved in cell wall biosynthesis|nr:hypothetical protein [Thermoleophilaceae bacterium]